MYGAIIGSVFLFFYMWKWGTFYSTTCLEYDREFIKKYKVLSNAKEFIVGKSN
jgi:hypothetical protein